MPNAPAVAAPPRVGMCPTPRLFPVPGMLPLLQPAISLCVGGGEGACDSGVCGVCSSIGLLEDVQLLASVAGKRARPVSDERAYIARV